VPLRAFIRMCPRSSGLGPDQADCEAAANAGAVLPPQALKLLENSSTISVVDGLAGLGLRLTARRMPLDVLVIDSIERTPTPN